MSTRHVASRERSHASASARDVTTTTRAIIISVAPVTLAGALLWHPPIMGRLPNDTLVAEHVAAGPTRWALSHLATAFAAAFVVLAFVAIRGALREAGDRSHSALGLGLVVVGSTAYAVLPGMEFAPWAAFRSGADPEAAQEALTRYFVPVLIVGGVLFLLGVLCFAAAIVRTRIVDQPAAGVVVGALIVMALSRLVPIGLVQFYVQSAAALLALWPLAIAVRNRAEA